MTKSTGWILPNGKFVALGGLCHEDWLGVNTDLGEDRLEALNHGYARARQYGGKLTLEVNAEFFRGRVRRAVEDLFVDHAEGLDAVVIHLLDDDGNVLRSASEAGLFQAENPVFAALEILENLR